LEILGVVFAAILFAMKITFLVARRTQLIGCVERQEVTDWNPRVLPSVFDTIVRDVAYIDG
jgi:hypothetical protein